ncbi:MAG: PulJ/GspJ family protein, partial [Solirubrobacteraceae bacterium]
MSAGLRREDGFTLVELLIAMSITLVLLFAALTSFDAFNTGAASTTRQTNAEDAARTTVNRIVGVLRNAGAPTPVSGAQPATVITSQGNDLVFRTTAWPGESELDTGTHVGRMCLDTTTHVLWFDGLRSGAAGPTSPGSACPSAAAGWTHQPLATKIVNTAAQPVFRYGAATPVRSVGISLRTESGTVARTRPLALHSGGALRGALAPQVTPGDISNGGCESGKALLTLNIGAGGSTTDGARLSASNAIV